MRFGEHRHWWEQHGLLESQLPGHSGVKEGCGSHTMSSELLTALHRGLFPRKNLSFLGRYHGQKYGLTGTHLTGAPQAPIRGHMLDLYDALNGGCTLQPSQHGGMHHLLPGESPWTSDYSLLGWAGEVAAFSGAHASPIIPVPLCNDRAPGSCGEGDFFLQTKPHREPQVLALVHSSIQQASVKHLLPARPVPGQGDTRPCPPATSGRNWRTREGTTGR